MITSLRNTPRAKTKLYISQAYLLTVYFFKLNRRNLIENSFRGEIGRIECGKWPSAQLEQTLILIF